MKRVIIMALAALLALAAFSAAASAHEFKGKGGTLKIVSSGVQKFSVSGGTTECTKIESASGTAVNGTSKTQIVKVKYTGCTVFGTASTVSEAEYEFNAEGSVAVKKDITINVPVVGCSILVLPTSNTDLTSVAFSNTGKNLKESSSVKGITYETTGGFCGASGTNGTYSGEGVIEASGGTIEWK